MALRKVAVALALVGALLATAAIATGAIGGSTAAPVGSGKQTATNSVCGLGTARRRRAR